MTELSILVPTYNERENILPFLKEVLEVLKDINVTYEIIFIDDNSPDQTWAVIQEISELNPNIKLVRRFREKGLSSAVLRGMEIARGKFFLVMDSDLQHDPKIIPQMLEKIRTYDLVIASRNQEGGSYGKFSKFRKGLSFFANFISRKILFHSVSDPMSGYFLIRKEIFYELAPRLNPRGFKILLEILGKSRNLKISEIGYEFRTRQHGESKLNVSVVESYFLALLEIAFGNFFSVFFTRYALVGVSGIFVNLAGQGIGNFIFQESSHNYVQDGYLIPSLAVGLGFLLSVVHNFYWNNVWTFSKFEKQSFRELLIGFLVFFIISSFGFFIQISVWKYTHSLLSMEFKFPWLTYFCNFLGILAATVGNYYLNKTITWKTN